MQKSKFQKDKPEFFYPQDKINRIELSSGFGYKMLFESQFQGARCDAPAETLLECAILINARRRRTGRKKATLEMLAFYLFFCFFPSGSACAARVLATLKLLVERAFWTALSEVAIGTGPRGSRGSWRYRVCVRSRHRRISGPRMAVLRVPRGDGLPQRRSCDVSATIRGGAIALTSE